MGMKTKFRVLQRDFAELSNGKKVIEYEEVVVGSKTMTFEEYIELRVLAFIIFVTNQGIVFDAIQKFLREQEIDVFELYYGMFTSRHESSEKTQSVIEQYKRATIDELWDSPEELLENFQKDSEYKKLLNGEAGTNVIYHYKAVVISELMGDWTEHVIKTAHNLIQNSEKFDENLETQFQSVANYCRGLSHNVLGQDRLETNPQFEFEYNIPTWLSPKNNTELYNFKLDKKLLVSFQIDDEQFKMVQDNIDVYGHSRIGKSKTLKMLPNQKLWRKPLINSNHTTYLCWDDE